MHFFLGCWEFSWLLLHDVTGCFRRVFKTPMKIGFFEHPFGRCRTNRKTRRKRKKRPKKNNTHFLGGLENGQEVVPPFFPKKGIFQNPQKPNFIVFPEKWMAATFFWKRLCYKEDTFRGANNENLLGSFRQKISLWGDTREAQWCRSFCCFCCCCFLCFFFFFFFGGGGLLVLL